MTFCDFDCIEEPQKMNKQSFYQDDLLNILIENKKKCCEKYKKKKGKFCKNCPKR